MRKKYGKYYATIGLEIHVALKTKEKLFSSTQNNFEIDEFALLDVGTPGILPVLSKEPIEMAIAFGLGVKSEIQKESIFERKHYFYPDLPLGYQITQQHHPILLKGKVKIIVDGEEKWVDIEHAHLECDAAKSIHDLYHEYTAIDISRCASPLLEIVSMPCMYSPQEAKEYAKQVHSLVTFLNICDGKLEEGSFRVDASISLSETEKLGTRVEIKNISSFSFLETALEYEIQRQKELLDNDKLIDMETRLFNEKTLSTHSMRKKETVDEYRYMPDPDIVPLVFKESLIEKVKEHYLTDFFVLKEKLKKLFEHFLIEIKEDELSKLLSGPFKSLWLSLLLDPSQQTERKVRILAYWLEGIEIQKEINMEILTQLDKSNLAAKELKATVQSWQTGEKPLQEYFPKFISQDNLSALLLEVLKEFPDQVNKYKLGETKMAQFIMGKAMSKLKGSAPANLIKEELEKLLNN